MGRPRGTTNVPEGNEGRFVGGVGIGVASMSDVVVTVIVGSLPKMLAQAKGRLPAIHLRRSL